MVWRTFLAACLVPTLSFLTILCGGCRTSRCGELDYLEPEHALMTVEGAPHEDPIPTFQAVDFVGLWVETDASECEMGARVNDGDILELFGVDLDADGVVDREHLFVIYGLAPAPILLDPHTAELTGHYNSPGVNVGGRLIYNGRLIMSFWVWFADTGYELSVEYTKVSN